MGLLNHGFIIMHNVTEKLHQYLLQHLAYHSVLFCVGYMKLLFLTLN